MDKLDSVSNTPSTPIALPAQPTEEDSPIKETMKVAAISSICSNVLQDLGNITTLSAEQRIRLIAKIKEAAIVYSGISWRTKIYNFFQGLFSKAPSTIDYIKKISNLIPAVNKTYEHKHNFKLLVSDSKLAAKTNGAFFQALSPELRSDVIYNAVMQNDEETLFLLERSMDNFKEVLNEKDHHHRTVLYYALQEAVQRNVKSDSNEIKGIKWLLEHGADPNIDQGHGSNAWLAAQGNAVDETGRRMPINHAVLDVVLETGKAIFTKENRWDLLYAIDKSDLEAVKKLVEHGAPVHDGSRIVFVFERDFHPFYHVIDLYTAAFYSQNGVNQRLYYQMLLAMIPKLPPEKLRSSYLYINMDIQPQILKKILNDQTQEGIIAREAIKTNTELFQKYIPKEYDRYINEPKHSL